jgi:hypothetical protein
MNPSWRRSWFNSKKEQWKKLSCVPRHRERKSLRRVRSHGTVRILDGSNSLSSGYSSQAELSSHHKPRAEATLTTTGAKVAGHLHRGDRPLNRGYYCRGIDEIIPWIYVMVIWEWRPLRWTEEWKNRDTFWSVCDHSNPQKVCQWLMILFPSSLRSLIISNDVILTI